MQVKEWPTLNSLLHDAQKCFDASYDPNIRSRSQLKHMQKIEELLESLEHFGETEYSFEIRFCGKEGCGICAVFGRSVRTSCGVNNKTREEVLRF